MKVTFLGDQRISNTERIAKWLEDILPALIEGGADKFYLGNHGDFDYLAALAVQSQKLSYSNILAILISGYPNRQYDTNLYDSALYPPLENDSPDQIIVKCRQFMISISDVVICGSARPVGDWVKFLELAKSQGKSILQYPFVTLV